MDYMDGYSEAKGYGSDAESETVVSLQEKSYLWSKLIAIIGGDISFHKCIWQFIGWDYTQAPKKLNMNQNKQLH